MTENNNNSLIDDCQKVFDEWASKNLPDWKAAWDGRMISTSASDKWNHFAAYEAWQAARDHYAPKLSEEEASKIMVKSLSGHILNLGRFSDVSAKIIIKALVAAGVRFKEQRVEGSET